MYSFIHTILKVLKVVYTHTFIEKYLEDVV